MANVFLSPGIFLKETDLSTITSAFSTTTAAIVGFAKKGSLDKVFITNKQQFIQEYGEPVVDNYFHYTALAFLDHGTQLWCRRTVNTDDALYGGISIMLDEDSDSDASDGFATGLSIPDATAPATLPTYAIQASGYSELFQIVAKDPGVWGNSLSVIIRDVKGATDPAKPGVTLATTEQYTFIIDVYLTDEFGTASKVESWKVSRKTKVDGYGKQLNLEDKINGYSNYIFVLDDTAQADTLLPAANATAIALAGGADGTTPTANQIAGNEAYSTGWYTFMSAEEIDIRILIGGGFPGSFVASDLVTLQTAMKTVVESRKDCFAIFDIPYSACKDPNSVTSTTTYRDVTQNFDTSYAAMYGPWAKVNDPFNDVLVEVPLSGFVGAQFAYNDYVKDSWHAPAGFERGMVNVQGLTKIYNEAERDVLYEDGVNPVQVFRGEGIVIWGQKTLQRKASALDRVNVRRLLIQVEKTLAITLRQFVLSYNNDALTRFRVAGICTEYLDSLAVKGAFTATASDSGYKVICNETNNTPSVIDANELHVDVFIKPAKTVEFIQLQTIITQSGASFNELIARGVLL